MLVPVGIPYKGEIYGGHLFFDSEPCARSAVVLMSRGLNPQDKIFLIKEILNDIDPLPERIKNKIIKSIKSEQISTGLSNWDQALTLNIQTSLRFGSGSVESLDNPSKALKITTY
ncbi:hypothetical protein NGAV_gp09 [Hapavirus ngaingan]|uniref:Uncharacterized protein U5/U6 n=1 Tax=Hapavirus ngaingan TaxID=1972623 RepID=D3GGL9_9RHAB|nr:hypothetical protein NGAV_gp09 [Hapavirus ngaingan]ACX83610.1 unknown [Hapavirus ngaingan]